jgi:hypothetical protein
MHLAFMAHRPGVSIRIIPNSIGPHAGLTGSFMLMGYARDDQLPVVCVEYAGASLFIDEPEILEAHVAVINQLDRSALDEGQSRSWLMNLASEYDQPSA